MLDCGIKILDVNEYLKLLGYNEKIITLKELEEMELDVWNYPLDELDHIVENDLRVILVRFPKDKEKYEYRWCEIYD